MLCHYLLGAERICASPVHVGSGTVRCAHGVMPVPAPATANILEGIPVYGGQVQGELCTPTGAALLRYFAEDFGPMPLMQGGRTGIGIGTKTFAQANCVRAFLGEGMQAGRPAGDGEITELVCNIDDMTPEALAHACARLLEQGALDVYTVPGTMKKGRPGHVLTVLCSPEREEDLAGWRPQRDDDKRPALQAAASNISWSLERRLWRQHGAPSGEDRPGTRRGARKTGV